jgi:hypothetical protein
MARKPPPENATLFASVRSGSISFVSSQNIEIGKRVEKSKWCVPNSFVKRFKPELAQKA